MTYLIILALLIIPLTLFLIAFRTPYQKIIKTSLVSIVTLFVLANLLTVVAAYVFPDTTLILNAPLFLTFLICSIGATKRLSAAIAALITAILLYIYPLGPILYRSLGPRL